MDNVKKSRGAWVIHVRGSSAEQNNGAKHGPASNDDTPHYNNQRNKIDEKGG